MGQRILALELSGDRVRAALAERSYKALELVGVYEQDRAADEPDLAGALARIVAATGRPDIAISALPGELVAKRLLTLPFTDRRRLNQVVPFALEEHLPFAVDDAAVAFARVGRQDGASLVIAAFARKAELHRHLQLLATSGLDPKTVTLSTHALAGLLARARNGRGGTHLVLEIDETSTSMVLIDEAGTPRSLRTVGRGLAPPAGARTPPNIAAPMLTAIRQTLLAHSSDQAPPDLVLAGSAAATPELRDELASALEVPIRDLGDFDCSALIQGVSSEPVRFAACLAMLLGEAPVAPLELLNFRQQDFVFRGRSGALRPLRLTTGLAIAALAIAAIHVILAMAVDARQLHLLNRQIVAVTAPALGNPDAATARAQLQAKIADMNHRLRLLGGNLGHGSPLDVLLEISRAIPPTVALQADTLQVDDSGLKLGGSADSFATVDLIKRALERSGNFGAIQVEHAGAGANAGKVEFRLSAELKDTAGQQ
ncbi:MAG TPA: PilN domain-containing protein [Candidatus Binataceae bacterium]|nr:PilN domain-containing protein [Candidatus Binataceae bacterium]